MAFCKFSSESIISSNTAVDNIFINDYLPFASANYVKVYLYGLYKCSNSSSYDNNLESFSKILKLTEDEILEAFRYWEGEGLVQIINVDPIEIRYLPVRNAINNIKKFNKNKYESFNTQIQAIIEGRMITPNEYAEYYTVIESYHMEPEALLMIAKFCVNFKGNNLGHAYITTIAKNWAREGITTCEKVEEKLLEQERNTGKLKDLLKALKLNREASIDERSAFIKWQKEYKFDFPTILACANMQKGKGGFSRLDSNLTKYFQLGLTSEKEIFDYEKTKENILELSKQIVKKLGLYYESYDAIIEMYINPWLKMGFGEEMLLSVADLCLKQNVRTLEGMNTKLSQFNKLGILTEKHLSSYVNQVVATDEFIAKILAEAGIERLVNSFDRSLYRTWSYTWAMDDEVILYAASLAKGAINPMQYASKILSAWHDAGVKTVEMAKAEKVAAATSQPSSAKNDYHQKDYSKAQLDALFDNLDEVISDVKKWNN